MWPAAYWTVWGSATRWRARSGALPAVPVAAAVARGEADLGLQATSEMLNVPGTEYLGALPPEVQQVTVLAAALTADARHGGAGRAFIDFLRSPAAMPVIMKTGLEPIDPDVQH